MKIQILGITGPSGAGKSLLCQSISARGIPVIDADRVYHSLLLPPSECLEALRRAFGDEIFSSDGKLDRAKLGAIVFNSSEKLELLNSTVLSVVVAEARLIIDAMAAAGHRAVIFDAPTLIESGFHKECYAVVSVISSQSTRVARISERDGISTENALARIHAQKDDDFYKAHSDFVIVNDGNLEELEKSAIDLFDSLVNQI